MRYCYYARTRCPLLSISNIGYAADPFLTRFGPGVRNHYNIHYIISGKGYFNGNPVSAGEGFLVTPGMQEHYYPDSRDPWEYLWFITPDPAMAPLFPMFHADEKTNIFSYDYIYAVQELASFLLAHKDGSCTGYEMLEIFLGIFNLHHKDRFPDTVKSNAQLYIEAAVKYISSNLHCPITVEELANFLGVSQVYLFKIFKARFAKSPKQYILEQKLLRAQTLLGETDISVTYVANSVGFPDVLSFSKCFRSKLGLSPQSYRKQKERASQAP